MLSPSLGSSGIGDEEMTKGTGNAVQEWEARRKEAEREFQQAWARMLSMLDTTEQTEEEPDGTQFVVAYYANRLQDEIRKQARKTNWLIIGGIGGLALITTL